MNKKLEEMVSDRCFKEIKRKVKEYVGSESFNFIFPAVVQAIEHGSANAREKILIDWLNVDSCRVCSNCGEIMEEGWYLDLMGYACSDECAMKIMGVPDMEHFRRYRIYKADIDAMLEDEGEGRKEEELTQEEIEELLDQINNYSEACYTEWY